VDVGEVAKMYGGGGHRNAAGFETPYAFEKFYCEFNPGR
jgi:nanoRNase/pAp phosphatase (c-di-AMP/oligoRNAs hydrolase)